MKILVTLIVTQVMDDEDPQGLLGSEEDRLQLIKERVDFDPHTFIDESGAFDKIVMVHKLKD